MRVLQDVVISKLHSFSWNVYESHEIKGIFSDRTPAM